MGIYQATVNIARVKRGKTDEFDDFDPEVQRLVANKFLVPYDDVAKEAQEAAVIVEAPLNARQAILQAIKEARQSAEEVIPEELEESDPAVEEAEPVSLEVVEEIKEDETEVTVKRPVGRPRKNPLPEEEGVS